MFRSFSCLKSSIPHSQSLLKMSLSTKAGTVHPTSLNSFNSNHSLYDKVRPDFHKEFVAKFLVDLGLVKSDGSYDTDKKVLELAAGTGKFTKNIVSLGWSRNDNLKIVEPSSGMLESFSKNFPDADARLGSSYDLPLEDDSVDAVIIAQGFHWFADKDSLKEIRRVLKPTGKLGMIWNFDSTENNGSLKRSKVDLKLTEEELKQKEGWEKIAYLSQSKDQGVPQYRKGLWRNAFEDQNFFDSDAAINEFQHKIYPFDKTIVYDYWLSRSYITSLPDDEKAKLKKQIEDTIESLPDYSYADKDKKFLTQFLGSEYYVVSPIK